MNARDRKLITIFRDAWPNATIEHEGRGERAVIRIRWPDSLWFVVGARSLNPIHEMAPGFKCWAYHEDQRKPWTHPDAAAFIADANARLAQARITSLSDAPANARDVDGVALYGETPRVDYDCLSVTWHGFGRGPEDDPRGFYGYPVWQPEAPIGAHYAGFAAPKDCDGAGDAD